MPCRMEPFTGNFTRGRERMRRSFLVLFAVLMVTLIDVSGAQGASINYTVKSGDNLWSVASTYHTTVDNIKTANHLQSDALKIGDKLTIPAASISNNSSNSATNTSSAGYIGSDKQEIYYVQPGDSLWRIATLHGMTMDEVKALNNNCSENLTIGQKLLVSGEAKNRQTVSRSAVSSDRSTALVQRAAQFLGTPYAYGGSDPGGFDCSGFVRYIYGEAGYNLPHNAAAQSGLGQTVSREELQLGDLVFFSCGGGGINHVGIYCGDGRFIHSSSPRSGGVIYSSLTDSYWGGYYISASRIINE